jgi:hypothetical protein
MAKARDHLWSGMQIARSASISSTTTAEQQKDRTTLPPAAHRASATQD